MLEEQCLFGLVVVIKPYGFKSPPGRHEEKLYVVCVIIQFGHG